MCLAETQEDLDTNPCGEPLPITIDLYPGDIFPFWVRVVVPVNWHRVEDKRDMRIGLRGPTIPLV